VATFIDLINDLRGRLNDADDSQVTLADKKLYLNYGIRATWPRLYKTARDTTLEYDTETVDYDIPAAVGSHSLVVKVEVETDVASNRYVDLEDYDVVPDVTDPILSIGPVGRFTDGARIRITAAVPLATLSADADEYDGPPVTTELPVLYAMGLCAQRRLDDRIDHRRFATMQNANGVSTADVMEVSNFWFSQFEILLDRMQMPLPAPGG
jgi:hypothetical protein